MSFAENLPGHGWDVTVVTASPPAEWPHMPEGVSVHHVPSPERKLGGGISTEADSRLDANPPWLKALGAVKGLLPIERQLSWYPRLWRAAFRIFRAAGVEALVTVVAPNVMMPIGHAIARRLGVPHHIDLRDDFADRRLVEPVTASYQALLNAYGHACLRRAQGISVVSPVTEDRLHALGLRARLVMNGYVEAHFRDVPWRARSVPQDGPLRLVHLGWLGDFRSIGSLTEAVACLDRDTRAQLQIDQFGLIDPAQAKLLADCPCPTAVHAQLPHQEAIRRMLEADMLVAIPGDSVPAALTGKLFEYLRTRRPVLLIAGDGAARQLAERAGIRRLVRPGDVQGLAALLRDSLKAKRVGTLIAESDEAFVRGLERRNGAELLARELDRLVT